VYGADPIAAIAALTGAIHHVHAKDTRIEDRAAVASRLETVPNERTGERAWNHVAVGTGHPGGVVRVSARLSGSSCRAATAS
jgi:sugar phosphate isomerase/epimerase